MSEPHPENFDWVSAKADWSLSAMIDRVREQSKTAVTKRNESLDKPNRYRFTIPEMSGNVLFTVWDSASIGQNRRAVDFAYSETGLIVRLHPDGEMLVAPVLDENGYQKCKVDGQLFDVWQVVRRVLEPLMFD